MAVRAKVLCENAVYGTLGAVAEHGWSVWLETPSGAFLFDTGQGQSIRITPESSVCPLEETRAILHRSSPHRSHGWLCSKPFTPCAGNRIGPTVPVHAHPDLFKDSFNESEGTAGVHWRAPHPQRAGDCAAKFHLAAEWQELVPGVCLSGEVPRRTAFELGDQGYAITTSRTIWWSIRCVTIRQW